MSTKYSSIITAIDTIISGITAVKEHLTYEPQEFSAYPAVTITPVGHHEEALSLRDTRRQYSFMIRVYGQMDNTRTNTQITVRDLADSIIDTIGLQSNIKLGNTCDYHEFTDCVFKYVQRGSSLYVAEITLKVQKAYARV